MGIMYEHVKERIGDGVMHGGAETWLLPIANFEAESGWDESIWVDAVAESHLSVRLGGANVRSLIKGRHASTGPGRGWALTPKGTPNHYACTERIRFAHIYLPDSLLDRCAATLGHSGVSGRLRDDLVCTAVKDIEDRAQAYVRRALSQLRPTTLEMEARGLLLIDSLLALHIGAPKQSSKNAGLAAWQVTRACKYLEDRITEDVTLDELSSMFGLSPNHFCRAFKVSTGSPPHRWQVQLRMARARDILQRTDMSVTGVATAVGYENAGQFSTVFRRVVGLSPSRFRRERTE